MSGETEQDQRLPWIGGFIAAGLWLLWSVPSILYSGMTGDEVGQAIGISLVALLVGLAIGATLHRLTMWTRSGATRFLKAAMRAAAGATAGYSLSLLMGWAQFPQTSPTWVLVVIPACATPWVLDSIEEVVRVRSQILLRRRDLIAQAAELMTSSTTQQSVIDEVRRTITTSVDAELSPVRDQIAGQLRALDDTGTVVVESGELISSAAQDSVRPLIDLLSSPESAKPEPIGLWGTIRAIVKTQPFHPLPLAIIYVIVNLPALVMSGGMARGLFDTTVGIALIFGILLTANRILRTGRFRHDVVFVSTFVVLQIPTVWYSLATTNMGGEVLVSILSSVVVSFLLVLLTSSLGSWQQRQETAQRTFGDLLADERIANLARAEVTADVARQTAHMLHGPVQARLAACAIAMNEASRAGDVELYRASLLEAKDALEAPLFTDDASPDTTIAEAVSRAVDPWTGLVDVELSIEPEAATALDKRGNVEKVAEEAVTNAVRHGGASRVTISVTTSGERVHMTVDDNGKGVTTVTPGLGSRLFDRIAIGEWSLTPSTRLGGLHLSIALPRTD